MSDILNVENKSIIITDPCYLMHAIDKNVDGDFSFYGDSVAKRSMSKMGFDNCIIAPTLYGDWSCSVYNINDYDVRNCKNVGELAGFFTSKVEEKNKIGDFCADSGMLCVVLADDVRNFNPGFFEWALFHRHCVTYIPNYTGEIGLYDVEDKNSEFKTVYRHIYGIGKGFFGYKNFYSLQTGY